MISVGKKILESRVTYPQCSGGQGVDQYGPLIVLIQLDRACQREKCPPALEWLPEGRALVPPCWDNCYPADHELMPFEIRGVAAG